MHTEQEKIAAKVMEQSLEAFKSFQKVSGKQRAQLLLDIGVALDAERDSLVGLAAKESHLADGRLQGELSRTIHQLKMFARMLQEGSWVQAIVDTALPDRLPAPRPDIRKMLRPLGPVVIFGASNFPFAFSTLGGDTASALAAGCPVVIKCHPGHPETSAAVAKLAIAATVRAGMHEHLIQHIEDSSRQIGIQLVQHPLTMAVGFTGSLRAGKALQQAIHERERPISLFAEMGSINPVFLLPGILKTNPQELATKLAGSTCMGVGQFCTNPGLIIVPKTAGYKDFLQAFIAKIKQAPPAEMLHEGIVENYHNDVELVLSQAGVELLAEATEDGDGASSSAERQRLMARARLAAVNADTFINNQALRQEVFGPFSLLVTAEDIQESLSVLKVLEGQLTTSIFADEQDQLLLAPILELQEAIAGRIIFNEVPTGVEVCAAMIHGGPYPASTNAQFTSVGGTAIYRWVRPVCYQGFPGSLLPVELQDSNPLSIMRLVNDQWNNQSI